MLTIFQGLMNLRIGEEIIYITNMGERRYVVCENKVIQETNVDILKDTDENTITLITCIMGKRAYRRCVIGREDI